ncbi:MAG: DUF4382 domain-containing protein [Steroidobacteraceae bacterium]
MSTHLSERSAHWLRIALGLLACFALAACQSRTDVSTGANVPAQYAHVWVTLTQVAFNASATAGPTDSGWKEFTLSSPQTIDLTTVTNGTLSEFASSLSLPVGTYNQMRLVLADSNTSLASSAQSAGALYNDEVDTTGSGGALERLPLAVPNAAQGITFAIDLTIAAAQQSALAAFACGQSSTSGLDTGTSTASTCESGTESASDCTAGTIFDSLIGTCIAIGNTTDTLTGTTSTSSSCALGTTFDSSTGACISTGTTTSENCSVNQVFDPTTGTCESSGLGGAATTSAAIDFDASRDLVPYTIGGQSGFLLIPHLSGYNLAQVGTIEGQIDISALTSTAGGVEVTAETPSSDGTRNAIVESVPLQSNGDFVLYPLPCAASSSSSSASSSSSGSAVSSCASSTQTYDLVIHGPGIETVVIQSVPVSAAPPSSATALSLSGVTLTAATSYSVNLSSAVSPPGAWIGFYQTLPDSSSVSLPYLIEARPVDPFTGTFDTAQSLSAGSLEYEVYAAGGSAALTSVTPSQGVSTYTVAASAPLYGDGPLTTTVSPPSGSATATFTAAAIPLPSGTTAETISGTVTVSAPGKYDKGELILTQDGALIAVTPLDAYLSGSSATAILFTSVPGGTPTSVYYSEAWVWNSSDPAGSLSRQPQSAPIDLSAGSASGVAISIN